MDKQSETIILRSTDNTMDKRKSRRIESKAIQWTEEKGTNNLQNTNQKTTD